MSAHIMTSERCQVFKVPAPSEKRHHPPVGCKPVTARSRPKIYDNVTVQCRMVPNRWHCSQAIVYKQISEWCEGAPLKGVMNAAQYGNSSPLRTGKGKETNRPSSGTKRGKP